MPETAPHFSTLALASNRHTAATVRVGEHDIAWAAWASARTIGGASIMDLVTRGMLVTMSYRMRGLAAHAGQTRCGTLKFVSVNFAIW